MNMNEARKRKFFDKFYDMSDDSPMVRFYEAEQKLSPADRAILGENLRRISFYSTYGAYGSATVAYFLPTIIYNYKHPGSAPPVNFRGKQVKPMFVFRRPFLSVFISLTTLVMTKLALSTFMVIRAGKDASGTRQKEIWNQLVLFPMMGLNIYGEYFSKSAQDPLYRMQDPRQVAKELKENPNAACYFPPIGALKKPSDPKDPSAGAAWQDIRTDNGYPKEGK